MTVLLAKDRLTKTPKGYAFIQYTSQDDAMLALENMDCKVKLHLALSLPHEVTHGLKLMYFLCVSKPEI